MKRETINFLKRAEMDGFFGEELDSEKKICETGDRETSFEEEKNALEFMDRKRREASAFKEFQERAVVYEEMTEHNIKEILYRHRIEDDREFFERLWNNFILRKDKRDRFDRDVFEETGGDLTVFDDLVFSRILSSPNMSVFPIGRIEVEMLPTGVLIRCFDQADFGRLCEFVGFERGVSNKIMGFKAYAPRLGLDVMAEMVFSKPRYNYEYDGFLDLIGTGKHEEAHSFNDAVFGFVPNEAEWDLNFEDFQNFSYEDLRRDFSSLTKKLNNIVARKGIDETLAFTRDGSFPTKIFNILKNNDLYNYQIWLVNTIKWYVNQNGKLSEEEKEDIVSKVESAGKKMRNGYLLTIEKLCGTIGKIQNFTDFDNEDIYLALALETAKANTVEDIMKKWENFRDATRIEYVKRHQENQKEFLFNKDSQTN